MKATLVLLGLVGVIAYYTPYSMVRALAVVAALGIVGSRVWIAAAPFVRNGS